MLMPRDVPQLQLLLGGLSYFRKFLPNLCKQPHALNQLLKQAVSCQFTDDMEIIVGGLVQELSEPPVLVFLDWDAVEEESHVFQPYCDASIGGLGATLDQEQTDRSIRRSLFLSRVTFPNKHN